MITFLIGIAILVGGYFTYGKFVERVFGPDDARLPPSKTRMALTVFLWRTGKTFSSSF